MFHINSTYSDLSSVLRAAFSAEVQFSAFAVSTEAPSGSIEAFMSECVAGVRGLTVTGGLTHIIKRQPFSVGISKLVSHVSLAEGGNGCAETLPAYREHDF